MSFFEAFNEDTHDGQAYLGTFAEHCFELFLTNAQRAHVAQGHQRCTSRFVAEDSHLADIIARLAPASL